MTTTDKQAKMLRTNAFLLSICSVNLEQMLRLAKLFFLSLAEKHTVITNPEEKSGHLGIKDSYMKHQFNGYIIMLSCMNTHKGAHKPFRGHRPFCKLTLLFDNTAHNYDICSDCPSLRINEEQRTEL